jgi:ABC transporter
VVSTTTTGGLPSLTIRSIAAIPSSTGMRRSISTTSGLLRTTALHARRAVVRLAHDLDVGCGAEDRAQVRAHHRLVVDDNDPGRATGSAVGTYDGMAASRQNPPSGVPLARSVPCTSSTRWRRPARPRPEPVRSLSGGQKRRLDLALGLIGGPELLYLDEPTTGFGPAARRGAWDLVRRLRAAGTTILLTTHDMAEAQALADRVVLLSSGVILAEGAPAVLGGQDAARARISFTLPAGVKVADLPVPASTQNGAVVIETAEPTVALHRLTGWAVRQGVTLAALTVDRPSLEDIYLRLTRDGARPGARPAAGQRRPRSVTLSTRAWKVPDGSVGSLVNQTST